MAEVSVGVLNLLLNVFVLIIIAICDRLLEYTVRNFAAARLGRFHRAPVIHDSDTWLLNVPFSILKYRRNPAILFTIICTVFLITSEITAELGLDTSKKCGPKKEHGLVVSGGKSNRKYTDVELGMSAGVLQGVFFLGSPDGKLSSLPVGLPKHITGKECIECLYNESSTDETYLARGCSIQHKSSYMAGELEVGVKTTDGAFKTISLGFRGTDRNNVFYWGMGDLTSNGKRMATFVIGSDNIDGEVNNETRFTYIEYSNQEHVADMLKRAQEDKGQDIWEAIRSIVFVQEIHCDVNMLDVHEFEKALMIYRTIQLENPAPLAEFYDDRQWFKPLTSDDLYRAVLAMKIMDDDGKMDDYYVYTECGVYDWTYIAPILGIIAIILLLCVSSFILSSAMRELDIPYDSRSWYRHSTKPLEPQKPRAPSTSCWGFNEVKEEMLLVGGTLTSGPKQVVFLQSFRELSKATNKTTPQSSFGLSELEEVVIDAACTSSSSSLTNCK